MTWKMVDAAIALAALPAASAWATDQHIAFNAEVPKY